MPLAIVSYIRLSGMSPVILRTRQHMHHQCIWLCCHSCLSTAPPNHEAHAGGLPAAANRLAAAETSRFFGCR